MPIIKHLGEHRPEHIVDDVWFMILRLLPPADLLQVAQTSIHFKTLVRDKYVWNKKIKEEFNTDTADTVISWGEHSFTITGFPAYVARHQINSPKMQYVAAVLLNAGGLDVNLAGNYGRTPLYWAAWNYHTETVQALLQADGIDVNLADNDGDTPLNWAAARGYTETVQALLQADGIDVNLADKYGRTPLYWAAMNGYTETVQALLQADGIDVSLADNDGDTPLNLAAMYGHTETVQLINEFIQLEKLREHYATLIQADKPLNLKVVDVLEDFLRSINSSVNYGEHPLTLFSTFENSDVMLARRLISTLENETDNTAIHDAINHANEALTQNNTPDFARHLRFIKDYLLPEYAQSQAAAQHGEESEHTQSQAAAQHAEESERAASASL